MMVRPKFLEMAQNTLIKHKKEDDVMNEQHKDIGKEIIQKLGTSHYIMWSYLENRNFTILSIDEIAQDLGRHGRTIQR